MFRLSNKPKGIIESAKQIMFPIVWEDRINGRKWKDFFGKYENQKWGQWDSDSCWCLGGAINEAEDQLEMLSKDGKFSIDAMTFFHKNGYIDSDGDFSLSERYLEILSGVRDNGNGQMDALILMQKYGCIPRSVLNYTNEQAFGFRNKESFDEDYFNANAITSEMMSLGQQFKKYVNISRQWIDKNASKDVLKAALKQAPLAIGIPIPKNVSDWNKSFIQYDGGAEAQHAVELYDIDDQGQYLIFDQYEPHLKVLSSDYLLVIITQGILNINPVFVPKIESQTFLVKFWSQLMNFFNEVPLPVDNIVGGKVL